MKFDDLHTAELLPAWAASTAFGCDAVDLYVPVIRRGFRTLAAPLTLDACLALSDEEMQAFYAELNILKYYPAISHETQAKVLCELEHLRRYLGTPRAMELLVEYIFDQHAVRVTVNDNEAWDAAGNLIAPDALDTFTVTASPEVAYLPANTQQLLLDNVLAVSRNSQGFDGFRFVIEDDMSSESLVSEGSCWARTFEDEITDLYYLQLPENWQIVSATVTVYRYRGTFGITLKESTARVTAMKSIEGCRWLINADGSRIELTRTDARELLTRWNESTDSDKARAELVRV